jgi:hypothetical protein
VVTRGAPSSNIILDPYLPIPVRSGAPPADWGDGTLAVFLDTRMEGRDATAKIKTTTIGAAGDADRRFVIEWSNMTTGVDFKTRLDVKFNLQLAVFADGRVEYRYKPATAPAGSPTPQGDQALLLGQGATIGIAGSSGAVVPLSVHRASLPQAGATYTFYPKDKLPPKGRAIVTLAKAAGVQELTLSGRKVTATIEAAYTVTEDTQAIRDISATGTAIAFGGDNVVPVDLPFAVDVFHEKWRSLGVSRSGAVGPWGLSAPAITAGFNFDPDPLPKNRAPNGFIAPFYALNGSAWCSGTGAPAAYYLVEGAAPARKVTILWKALNKCGAAANQIDVEAVLTEGGDVELLYGNLTSQDESITGKGVVVAMENGNGEVAFVPVKDTAARLAAGKRFVFKRAP